MSGTAFADGIWPVQNLGGAVSFTMAYQPEESGQTFVAGTPVEIYTTDGGVKVWDGTTVAAGIAGFAAENANNLGTTGLGAPSGFTPILSYGSVVGNYAANPNQPLAVITPPMVPMSDGRIRYWVALPGTVFIGKIGTSSGTPAAVATAITQVGVPYGLTKDPNNSYWYVDTNKNNAVQVVALSPLEPIGTVGGHVLFVILPAVAQIFG